ncbi:HNH endonuclease [Kutzneria viridogrisea]|uniref:HNH endonuclease n=1 Tax=Kutzneria viridogrisea TaxID=47990 RepID=A0ABR6BY39_9PSEU|nr:hypothetical protein [Kutzneria viridogrisea]
MIRIRRLPLPTAATGQLAAQTAAIGAVREHAERVRFARERWRRGSALRKPIRETLARMAPGLERCMYCGDNQGSSVDHHEPVSRNPLRTFDWLNHLLTCSLCNSHYKGDKFPLDARGEPLLIDPSAEDPLDHMVLALSTGEYLPLSEKGRVTIEVCGLSRPVLNRGRVLARSLLTSRLRDWGLAQRARDSRRMAEVVRDVHTQPFADVCQSMLRQATSPGAEIVFERDPGTLKLLRRPDLRKALLI